MPARQLGFGPVKGPITGSYHGVAATQYFAFLGGAFCYLDASGYITLALTATNYLFGWALAPKSVAASSSNAYYTSSSTAGADRMFVISSTITLFGMPTGATTYAVARDGECTDLISVNDGTVQSVNLGTNSTDVLIVDGGELALDIAYVRLNPEEIQMDT